MAEMKGRISSCSFLSTSDGESCKLPLLDGETSGSSKIIRTNVELDKKILLDVCRRDSLLFHSIICTAWALVLRCYTGQDQVTFDYLSENTSIKAPTFRMVFDQDETLSNHTENVKVAIAGLNRSPSAITQSYTVSDEIGANSRFVNTAVAVFHSDAQAGGLSAKKAQEIVNVSNDTWVKTLSLQKLIFRPGTNLIRS